MQRGTKLLERPHHYARITMAPRVGSGRVSANRAGVKWEEGEAWLSDHVRATWGRGTQRGFKWVTIWVRIFSLFLGNDEGEREGTRGTGKHAMVGSRINH